MSLAKRGSMEPTPTPPALTNDRLIDIYNWCNGNQDECDDPSVSEIRWLVEQVHALTAARDEAQQLRERAEADADDAIAQQLAAVKRADAAEAQLAERTRERDEAREARIRAEADADDAIAFQLAAVKRAEAAEARLTETLEKVDELRREWESSTSREASTFAELLERRQQLTETQRVVEAAKAVVKVARPAFPKTPYRDALCVLRDALDSLATSAPAKG